MNFLDTLGSVDLILKARQVPLLVGETGIGKTSLAIELARRNDWKLVTIDGNLLKEGEIGGLPTIETYTRLDANGNEKEEKTTIYAVHNKLRAIDAALAKGKEVLLFIDEINRCEHAVQQELMNLILNREINGYVLSDEVKILAAMNPADTYDYQTVEMDDAQQNRFVWLYMESDYKQWLDWAIEMNLDEQVINFIATYPEYLYKQNEDDLNATPRSYERVSALYKVYKEHKDIYHREIFLNVIKGNVGKVIAEEFVNFVEADHDPLLTYEDVFSSTEITAEIADKIKKESPTRLFLMAKNILRELEAHIDTFNQNSQIDHFMEFLNFYPVDLRIGVMKDIRNTMPKIYEFAKENKMFIDAYFAAFR